MEETQKFFEPTPVDRDATLVTEPDGTLLTPRFDEAEAGVARPVVPLAESVRPVIGRRRQWPIALVLISALAGGVVSLFAFRLYQQRQQQQAQVGVTETGEQTPETDSTPAPTQMPAETEAIVTTAAGQAQSESPTVIEEFEPVNERNETSDARPARKAAEEEAKPAARDERREEAKPAARVIETRPRRAESSPAPRQVERRDEDARRDERMDEDFVERRRERRRQRREERRGQGRGEGRGEPRRNIDRIKDIFEGAPPR